MARGTTSAYNAASAVIDALKKKGFTIEPMTIQVPKEDNPDEYEEKTVNYTEDFIKALVDEIFHALSSPLVTIDFKAVMAGSYPVQGMATISVR